MNRTGWLTSLTHHKTRATLTFIDSRGQKFTAQETFPPSLYALPEPREAQQAAHVLSLHPLVLSTKIESKKPSLLDSHEQPVIKIETTDERARNQLARDALRAPGIKETMGTRLSTPFAYLCARHLTYYQSYDVETDSQGELAAIHPRETHDLPSLNLAALHHLPHENAYALLTEQTPRPQHLDPTQLPEALAEHNTDLLFTWNEKTPDGFSVPANLRGFARRQENPLRKTLPGLPRECAVIDVHADLHADIYYENDSLPDARDPKKLLELGKQRLPRIIELSHMTGAPPETVSRVSAGTLNTFLHTRAALENNYLTPDSKKLVEQPKTLSLLRELDKGGTVLYPPTGLYRNVAKLDFASMYPTIIVNHNISPDTLHCPCCGHDPNAQLPFPHANWHTCRKHAGIIPQGIHAILTRRLGLKHAMKHETDPRKKAVLDARQRALKNLLVTSFGYLGFSNFAFSNVECKESVIMIGRAHLERTKTLAEKMNLTPLYGIVDSLFLANGTPQEYAEFARAATKLTGIPLELDAHFPAIAFPAASHGGSAANKVFV